MKTAFEFPANSDFVLLYSRLGDLEVFLTRKFRFKFRLVEEKYECLICLGFIGFDWRKRQ